jgi:excisionase family DNA binding protein
VTPNRPKRALDLTDELFTVEEVASILKLNQQTVRNFIDDGHLPAVRIGRRVRIRRVVLEDVLEHGLKIEGEESEPDAD